MLRKTKRTAHFALRISGEGSSRQSGQRDSIWLDMGMSVVNGSDDTARVTAQLFALEFLDSLTCSDLLDQDNSRYGGDGDELLHGGTGNQNQMPACTHFDPVVGVDVHVTGNATSVGAATTITVGAAMAHPC